MTEPVSRETPPPPDVAAGVFSHTLPSAERYADFLRAVAAPDVAPVEPDDEDAVVAALAEASGITVLGPPGTLP